MRILHTSDWHLGRQFHRVDLLNAQERQLDHLVEVVRTEGVDLVVVAGDVYDRALPSPDTVALLDDGLDRLLDTGAQILMTSGNHDSAIRLGFGARRSARAGLHLRTTMATMTSPVLIEDRHGQVACFGVPYLEPGLVAQELGVARSHQAVLGESLARISAHRTVARSVVAAHAFVMGGQPSESERDIRVGGVDTVSAETFAGFDYAALGHLHGRQRVSDSVRYSGSLLPYSFSEARQAKGSWLVELGAPGSVQVQEIPNAPHRRLARLRGTLAELLMSAEYAEAEEAFCEVVLTDAQRPRNAMEQVRCRFPHTVALSFAPDVVPAPRRATTTQGRVSDVDLCCAFLSEVRHHEESEQERVWLSRALEHARAVEVSK